MSAYRSPWSTENHEIFRASVRKLIETEFVPSQERWVEQGHVEPEIWRKAGDIGMLCSDVPAEYGGGGGDFGFDAITYEELARGCISSFGNGIQSIVGHYLVNFGTEEQKKRWLPRMASGEIITAVAMTEPGTGSDLQAVKTRAIRDGDIYVVNGSKTFITNGHNANLVCIVCKTNPQERAKGISLLFAEVDGLAGFRRGKPLKKIGQKGQDTAELFFDDCRVPVENVLGGVEGRGFYQLMEQLPRERLLIAVTAVGVIESALNLTIEYAKNRKAFGKSLIEFQNSKFKLAECTTEATLARVFLDHCIERINRGALDTETASMAKWWCTQKQFEITSACLQLHGGYGYMAEYPIANYFADSRVQMIYGGTNEIMKEVIARSL